MDTCNLVSYGSNICGCFCPFSCHKTPETPTSIDLELEESVIISMPNIPKKVLEISQKIKNSHHLPNDSDDVTKLVYLTFLKIEKQKSPYTKKQLKIFERSKKADHVALKWLRLGIVAGGVLSSLTSFALLPGYTKWIEKDSWKVFIPYGLMVVNITATILGYAATGTNPHFASNAANERQDQRKEIIEPAFQKLARKLVELKSQNFELAIYIAKNLSLKAIEEAMKKDDPQATNVDLFLKPLRTAKHYVLDKSFPENGSDLIELSIKVEKLERLLNPYQFYEENQIS